MKTAVIFGVTGQDGSYLAELLLDKGYSVIGVSRRVSTGNDANLAAVMQHPEFRLVRGDVTDAACVYRILHDYVPAEVYNLAAQSHVGDSFVEPSHTTQVTYLGALNCLEAIRNLKPLYRVTSREPVRFYQASSSEMFGTACSGYCGGRQEYSSYQRAQYDMADDLFQDESTLMLPCSPYAIAKLAAHNLCRVYRDSYGIFACSGILFNHESPRRGINFVTRKITSYIGDYLAAGASRFALPPLKLGNLHAMRDWGHAKDYVRAMWLMLQQDSPDDFVICTGKTHSVESFLFKAFQYAGIIPPFDNYYEIDLLPVRIDQSLYRPCEVPYLRGSFAKAKSNLNWEPEISFDELVRDMVYSDVGNKCGFDVADRLRQTWSIETGTTPTTQSTRNGGTQ